MMLRSRLDYYLAKIAGVDVSDIKLVPNRVINKTEDLLDKIAQSSSDADAKVEALETSVEALETSVESLETSVEALEAKVANNVPNAAGSAPTAEEFNALIAALVSAGLMKQAQVAG